MFLATPGLPPPRARVVRDGRHRARRRRGRGVQLPRRAEDRRADGAHAAAAAAERRAHVAPDARLRRHRGRARPRAAVPLRQRADDVAHARDLRRLCRRLHGAPQARDAAEHRDRRRIRRDAAGAGMVGGHRRGRTRAADPVPHHLHLDAAAFLVARALPREGLRERRPADAPRHARPALHAAADRALHVRARRRVAAALRHPHERHAVPCRRARRSASCSSRTRCGSTARTATPSRGRRSNIRSTISRRCSRRSSSTTTGDERAHGEGRGALVRLRLLSRWRLAALRPRREAAIPALRRHRVEVRPRFRAHRPQRQGAHPRRFSRQGGGALLRLHAMPGCLSDDARRRWRKRSGAWARTPRKSRCSS